MEVLGLFRNIETAAEGVNNLLGENIPEDTVTSLSSVPIPKGTVIKRDHSAWFQWVTLAGGVIGAAAGFLLAAGTAMLYPLYTGDKPIISMFPVGIITYEFAMLFAIIGTIAGMLFQMRLPCFSKKAYDPEITTGMIGISVICDTEQERDKISGILDRSGAVRIRTDEEVK
ncbi:MAG: quinol:electron acceptor oxidoreductase subunit ActD [Nitrospirota bacterium]